jgi:hypothetical protein
MDDPVTLDSIVSQLRALLQSEYQRGADDALRRLMEAAQSTFTASSSAQRAPLLPTVVEHVAKTRAGRGAPDALIGRVLASRYPAGANSLEIKGMADSDAERKVSLSGIRFALDRGKESGRYRHQNGDWFLTEAPSAETEGAS